MDAYGPLARLYDELTYDVDYSAFADYYENFFNASGKKVKTLLDIACGTGTLTLIMAKRGYDMIAADASGEMLCVAEEKSLETPGIARPMFLCQPMTELDLYGTVDAAYSSLDSVNYLPPGDVPELFRLLHLFIEPDGVFIFDINSPERLRSLDGSVSVDENDDRLCLWRAEFDRRENALFYDMDIFTRSGTLWRRSVEEHIEYLHDPDRLKALLEAAGFTDVRILRDGPQCEIGRIFITAHNTPHEV